MHSGASWACGHSGKNQRPSTTLLDVPGGGGGCGERHRRLGGPLGGIRGPKDIYIYISWDPCLLYIYREAGLKTSVGPKQFTAISLLCSPPCSLAPLLPRCPKGSRAGDRPLMKNVLTHMLWVADILCLSRGLPLV
jgi:hypothetical protein